MNSALWFFAGVLATLASAGIGIAVGNLLSNRGGTR
jgi:hypothetical protein